ncbi:MAG TPA: DUF3090 family protein [Candidatus Dormibacteraeota bacterium]|nr:DUF3090 family protein [Candidatus Dormibacteraeota bacterium]
MAIYELDPVDAIAVSAVGEPGQRRFFLLATGSGRTLTLGCEKSQIQALILRLRQMLEVQQIETQPIEVAETAAQPAAHSPAPGEPEWQIGELGLGYHEARGMFVLVASEGAAAGEGGEPAEEAKTEDAPSVRFWLSADQVIAFSKQAESVLSAGRPLCPRCGLPMDPAGHPCPVMNGARPIF